MQLKNCRESYYENSRKASDICRKLGFAGLALIWAFKITIERTTTIPCILRWAAALFIGGLALDFIQYITGTIIWGAYHRYKETHGTKEDQEFLAPAFINYPTNSFFVLKQVAIFIAWILLLISMFKAFWR